MKFKPANNIQDLQYFGEFGGVNPSISDSSTYTFLHIDFFFRKLSFSLGIVGVVRAKFSVLTFFSDDLLNYMHFVEEVY